MHILWHTFNPWCTYKCDWRKLIRIFCIFILVYMNNLNYLILFVLYDSRVLLIESLWLGIYHLFKLRRLTCVYIETARKILQSIYNSAFENYQIKIWCTHYIVVSINSMMLQFLSFFILSLVNFYCICNMIPSLTHNLGKFVFMVKYIHILYCVCCIIRYVY